jgi:hypothetical protein
VGLAASQSAIVATSEDGLAHFKLHVASEGDVYIAAMSPGFSPVAIRVVGGIEHRVRADRLEPGDALLRQGNGLISPAIQWGEQRELGGTNPDGRPWYSHVAIVISRAIHVGEDAGSVETAEMLGGGLTKHTLIDTMNGCTTLDVYRRAGVAAADQQRIVDSVRSYPAAPYAWGQITALGLAGAIGLSETAEARTAARAEKSAWRAFFGAFKLVGEEALETAEHAGLLLAAADVELRDAGKARMICSELAAWAYRDAGVALDVAPWWPDVKKQGLLTGLDAQMDYTTPNMIARSTAFRFQLSPAPPPSVVVVGGQIQIGEEIEFDTGSAAIGKRSEDVLAEVARAMAGQSMICNGVGTAYFDGNGVPRNRRTAGLTPTTGSSSAPTAARIATLRCIEC